jgi:MoaA/NifB/PqqE/SkfB family radical SAM enzyme
MYRFDPRIDALGAKWSGQTHRGSLSPIEKSPHDRQALSWASAPVDVIFPDIGIRWRHIPGEVHFRERRAVAPAVAFGRALAQDVERCLSGAPHQLTILKAVPLADAGAISRCRDCGNAMIASALDCALGKNAELVVERVHGDWCWPCHAGLVHNNGAELRQRLSHCYAGGRSYAVPSFGYDTAAHPRSIQLEITTRCNLTCGYCSNRLLKDRRDIDFDQLISLFDHIDLSVVSQVELTGLGEALLHPRLLNILNEIRRRGAVSDIGMVTNGVSLVRDRVAPLIEAGMSRIAVSIDTLDPERFCRQRPGTRLEKVLANVEDLARFRDETRRGDFRLAIHAVVTDDAYGQAEPLIEYSARLGLDLPIFTPLDSREAARDIYDRQLREGGCMMASEFDAFYTWVVRRWIQFGGSVKVPIRMQRLDERPVTPARRAEGFHHSALEDYPALWLCNWAIDKCYIANDGSMLSCCNAMTDMPRRPLANLGRHSLREVWGGDLLWAYRLPLALDLLPSGCLGCDQAPPQGRAMSSSRPIVQ